jgi:hypothetical protein
MRENIGEKIRENPNPLFQMKEENFLFLIKRTLERNRCLSHKKKMLMPVAVKYIINPFMLK